MAGIQHLEAAAMAMTVRAPGRVNLMGEHTDYSGGLVLPAAIDRSVRLECDAGGDRILLTSDRFDDPVDVSATGEDAPPSGWGRYVAAVAAELDLLGRPGVGLSGKVTSDLPDGAGLSSSAALEVGVALALCAAADFDVAPLDLAGAAQRAEHRAVGVPSGIMDQAASLLGRADHAVLLDCGSLEHRLVPLPADLALLIVDSGVSRRLEDSGYGRRRAELEEALGVLGGAAPSAVGPDEAAELAAAAGLGDVPSRRLRHVVTENARVRAVEAELTAPRGPDFERLGRLFAEGHASLRDDFEVSIPELDLLVELAVDSGAMAARMTGGGFGGAIVALVERERVDEVGAAVTAAYEGRTGRTAAVHVCRAADGACLT
jgi:galactokinase